MLYLQISGAFSDHSTLKAEHVKIHLKEALCSNSSHSGHPTGWRVQPTNQPANRHSPVVSGVKPNGKVCIYVDMKMHSTHY